MDSDTLDHAENVCHLEVMKDPPPNGWIRGDTKVGPVLEVKGAYHLYQYQSWIVISRRMNTYVNEPPEENGKSVHNEEVTTGAGTPVATKQKEQSAQPFSSLSTMVVPVDQRKWKDILAVDFVDKGSLSFSVSKTMTRILRHRGLYREADGAMDWNILSPMFCRDDWNALGWTNRNWLNHLHEVCDKKYVSIA